MRTGSALHHLDPVAGGVLRRDDGEGRAGAAANAFDPAMEHHVAAIEIGGQRHRLAGPDRSTAPSLKLAST